MPGLRVPIPLQSSARIPESTIREKLRLLDQISVFKPGRILGAAWTSDKVALRHAVGMCEFCWRRYKGWWKKAEYRPDWGWRYIGDCDGCGNRNVHLTLFHAESVFPHVLAPNHGLNLQP